MKPKLKITILVIIGVYLTAGLSKATPPVIHNEAIEDTARAVMRSTHRSYYYAAEGGKAHVKMTLTDKKGRTRVREFWLLRTDIRDMGDQDYYVYFTKPSDVRRTSVLTLKHADGDDDRWLYIPSVDLVKRIAADNKQESFVGSDFTFEDVSGRLPVLDRHELLPPEKLNDSALTVVKSTPLNVGKSNYAYRKTWIKGIGDFNLPVREEYYNNKDVLLRVFTIDSIAVIEGIPTAVNRTMRNVKNNHSTTIEFSDVTYIVELKPGDYTERLLKNPPRSLR